ncbi:MAG TPA: hypothetical protein VGK73_27935 [Polyangiaceae bacterium]
MSKFALARASDRLGMLRKTLINAALAAAACSVYEPSLLEGPEDGGAPGDAGTGGDSGASANPGGSAGSGRGGSSGSSGNTSGESGAGGGARPEAGEAGAGGNEPATGGAGGEGASESGGEGGSPASGGRGGGGGNVAGSAGAAGSAGGGAGAGAGGSAGVSGGGSGGTSGIGGTSGAGGSSGTSGSAGSGGSGGSGETCTGATGCARLSVPLTGATQRTFFVIDLPSLTNFTSATLSFRVLPVFASGGRILAFVQHGGTPPGDYNLIQGGLRTLSSLSGWTTVTWDVGATVPGFTFDKSVIKRIGIEVSGGGSTSWNDPTVLYLDSITITGPSVGPYHFGDASTVDSDTTLPNILGMANNTGDFVPGSTLAWLGP